MFGALSLLAACLTFSILHVVSPRHLVAAPKVVIPDSSVFAPKKVATPEVVYSAPTSLEISKLSISAPTVPVGLTNDNAMDIGKDMEKTAWYKLGPKPGEKGNAVIAGHYGWMNGQGSVFNDLHTLQVGDKISVHDERRLIVNFVVREIRKYNLNDDTADVFRSTDNEAHLNLVTCGGVWDYLRQTYSDRIVVFSDLET